MNQPEHTIAKILGTQQYGLWHLLTAQSRIRCGGARGDVTVDWTGIPAGSNVCKKCLKISAPDEPVPETAAPELAPQLGMGL